jgi:hypothetical protein
MTPISTACPRGSAWCDGLSRADGSNASALARSLEIEQR